VKRREFITLLGGAAAWPVAAWAQQLGRPARIGFLSAETPSARPQLVTAFVGRLRELGWTEGRTVAIEYRWTAGDNKRLADIVAEFIRLEVDVMVMEGTAATLAAKQATSSIPIVFPVAGDPVGNGLVGSLARPGGNVTGLSIQAAELGAKRLELLREAVPSLSRLAIMANVGSPNTRLEDGEVQSAAVKMRLVPSRFEIRRTEDIAIVFERMNGHADALYVIGDPLVDANRVRISSFALSMRLPTMFNFRNYVEAGGLMSYGTNFPDLYRRAAEYVDKILRGAKPADIPVEQPTKFELAINLITAKAIGLTIPPGVLALADEVVE
jgi:ABC-type uncharacterized transport system substrate-binding protein